MTNFSVLSDAAAGCKLDWLYFDRYVDPLISILTSEYTETPFTIGIFGAWGTGKSSLLQMLDERLAGGYGDRFVRVRFNPWIHRREPNMLVPILHTLRDTLNEDPKSRFLDSAKKIGEVLLRLGAGLLLKTFTANLVSIEKLEQLEQKYLEEHSKVQSEMRKLHETLQREADAIKAKGAQLVFLIDDLDRCEPSDIIDLLEAVKLFLDLRGVFVLLAVDKEIIDRGIEVKYSKFSFSTNRQCALGAEYLEKMVQLPLQLFPLHASQVRQFIDNLAPPQSVLKHLDFLQSVVLPNPRKIKRVLNILAVTNAIAEKSPNAKNLNQGVLAHLVVLQVQSSDLYAEAIKQPDLLAALDLVFARKIRVDIADDFKDFGAHRDSIQKLCQEYWRPETYLAPLFQTSGFAQIQRSELPLYLSMVGT